MLKAAPLIFDALPDWKITIAGHGKIKPYRDLITADRIKVINRFIEDQEAAVLFQRAKLVVLPYRSATSTGVIPLAYAFATPVIASDVGGLGALVDHGQTGLLIPPNDPELLAQAIVSVAKDEVYRQQLGENALAYSKVKLNWRSFAAAHLNVYREVLADFPTPKQFS